MDHSLLSLHGAASRRAVSAGSRHARNDGKIQVGTDFFFLAKLRGVAPTEAYRPQKQHLLRNQWIFVGDVAVLGCLLDVVLKD